LTRDAWFTNRHEPEEKSKDWKERREADMNEQVRIMGQIYCNSAHTVIWLGPSVTKDELAAVGWARTAGAICRRWECPEGY